MKKWELKVDRSNDDKFISDNSIVVFGVTILLAIILFVALAIYVGNQAKEDVMYESTSESEERLYTESFELSKIGGGINTVTAQVYNDTYLSCDGSNDYIKITPTTNDTLAFWYNSSTSEQWQFVVNNLGIKFTNGTQVDPVEYPVYWDGTDYYFCKTDATTYWEGSIDKISIYDGQLNNTQIQDLYGEERW